MGRVPRMEIAKEQSSDRGWRAAHGVVFLALLGLVAAIPTFGSWPWFWLVPLAGYFTLTALIPPLRRTFLWLRPGRANGRSCAAAVAVIVVSSVSLVAYQIVAQPELSAVAAALPVRALGGILVAGIVFPLVNATLEEMVFRGVLFDAVESEWGWRAAVGGTALLFGLGHMHGYPPGWTGACLAGVYGIMLGLLRAQTGGLLLPIIVHIAADATIYGILVNAGAI